MLVRTLEECEEFVAGDHTLLRELLHPDRQDIALRCSLAHAKLQRGAASTPHRLKTVEVYYIVQGRGTMVIDKERRDVAPGAAIYIPPGALQYIENTGDGDLLFLCIVDPAWQAEDELVLEAGCR